MFGDESESTVSSEISGEEMYAQALELAEEAGEGNDPEPETSDEANPEANTDGLDEDLSNSTENLEQLTETEEPADGTTEEEPAPELTLDERFTAQQGQFEAMQTQMQQSNNLVQQLLQAQVANQQPAQTVAPQDNSFFGYNTAEAFQAAAKADPQKAYADMIKHTIQTNPEMINNAVNDRVQAELAPVQAQRLEDLRNAQVSNLSQTFPSAIPGSPEYDAAASYMDKNPDIVNAISANPQLNLPEVLFKLANFDLLTSKHRALEKRMSAQRAKAQTAGTQTGGKATITSDGSIKGNVAAAAATARKSGEVVSNAQEAAMAQAFDRHM